MVDLLLTQIICSCLTQAVIICLLWFNKYRGADMCLFSECFFSEDTYAIFIYMRVCTCSTSNIMYYKRKFVALSNTHISFYFKSKYSLILKGLFFISVVQVKRTWYKGILDIDFDMQRCVIRDEGNTILVKILTNKRSIIERNVCIFNFPYI